MNCLKKNSSLWTSYMVTSTTLRNSVARRACRSMHLNFTPKTSEVTRKYCRRLWTSNQLMSLKRPSTSSSMKINLKSNRREGKLTLRSPSSSFRTLLLFQQLTICMMSLRLIGSNLWSTSSVSMMRRARLTSRYKQRWCGSSSMKTVRPSKILPFSAKLRTLVSPRKSASNQKTRSS